MSLHIVAMAEQQKVFRILNSIVDGAHWIYCVFKVVLKFVKIQLT